MRVPAPKPDRTTEQSRGLRCSLRSILLRILLIVYVVEGDEVRDVFREEVINALWSVMRRGITKSPVPDLFRYSSNSDG